MKEKILYLECFSGISGDMSVASLLDLGADAEVLKNALDSLCVDGYEIEIKRIKKCGIDACNFDVILESEKHEHHHHENENHEHHGHGKCKNHGHEKCQKHGHHHHHKHEKHEKHGHHHHHEHEKHEKHEHHHHHAHDDHALHSHHEHRNLESITKIIDNSKITDNAKVIAKNIFGYVARAEAIAHAVDINEVHFHEVGAVDSIVDIVAVAVCIDNLDIKKVAVSTIYEGQGYVKCQHGVIPVPVPAVLNIAKEGKMPIRITENRGEMITPTGIAIATALKTEEKLPESYTILKIGIGGGKKDFKNANILRAILIEAQKEQEKICILETNIDDCTGEALSYTMEKLLENQALDVYFTPIFMKKNRPATKLSVICASDKVCKIEEIIFSNLTTIGIRKSFCDRTTLDRKFEKKQTSLGEITFKMCTYNEKTYAYPEYEDVKKLCNEKNLDFDLTYSQLKVEGNK